MMIKNYSNKIIIGLFVLLMGCTSIAPYNQRAYEQATSLKVDALSIMNKATEPFTNHKQSIDLLKINLEKAYEYAKGRSKNEISTNQWAIIKDPSRNSLGGFLKKWENNTQLEKDFINEAKTLVSDAFDTVISLEGGKIKKN
jgi:hypothetical protein